MRPVLELDPSRISVVLGGGSTLGAAYHIGVLRALKDVWGVDPREVRTIVGTSSGAIVAGHVAAGLSIEELFRREAGDDIKPETNARLRRARDHGRSAGGNLSALDLVYGARPANPVLSLRAGLGGSPPGVVVAGLLPRGRQSHCYLERYFDDLFDHRWPAQPQLRLCTVDLRTGDRNVVEGDSRSEATPGRAIAASCALPGLHRPVRVDGRELIDGAVYSVDNADIADHDDTDVVVISSPLSTDRLLSPTEPLALPRNTVRAANRSDTRTLGDHHTVVELRPRLADVRAMGTNLATRDNRRRERVVRQAYRTTRHRLTAAADILVGHSGGR